jgi:rhodanese-related sulfurtransferase
MKRKTATILCAFAWLLATGLLRAEPASSALASYTASLKQKFPNVPTITPAELAALDTQPVLLDVREEKEFAVSHLRGAHRAEKDAMGQLQRLGVDKATPIVVYCSVGYRSSVLANKLLNAGFVNVRNLEGSIFAWANSGRPLVNANGPAGGVHPFNLVWGRYLDKAKWLWEPVAQP